MRTAAYSFAIYQGDTYALVFTVGNSDGSPLDTTAYTARLDLEATLGGATVLTLSTANGKIVQTYDGTTGKTSIVCTFSAADTAALSLGVYWYDFQWTLPDATVWTPMAGRINVTKDITP